MSEKDFNKDIFLIVPAYNEEKTVGLIVDSLASEGYNVILVNDGSKDETLNIVNSLKDKYPNNLFIYSHLINRGLAAALKTGLTAAYKHNAKYAVTFDADGQHDIKDINPVCTPLKNNEADVVIGSRVFEDMPKTRYIANTLMNLVTHIFYGVKVSDSQSGLRAFSNQAIPKIKINSKGYHVSSEIIKEIHDNNLRYSEVPIKTIYTTETKNKGTDIVVGIKILIKMIIDLFKG